MGNCVLWLNEDIYPFFPAEVHTELHFSMHILSYLFSKMFHVFSSSSRVLYAHFLWMINFQNQFESHWHHLSFAMFDFSSWVSLIITSSSETSEKTLLLLGLFDSVGKTYCYSVFLLLLGLFDSVEKTYCYSLFFYYYDFSFSGHNLRLILRKTISIRNKILGSFNSNQ